MDKEKVKKIIIKIVIAILVIVGLKVGYTCTYVGQIVVTYPWEEYTLSEKAAHYICGYGKAATKQELYDEDLIKDGQKMFKKFNAEHYKK